MQVSSELHHALQQLSERFGQAGNCWLVGGSCGLLLQNVRLDAMPRDIDVYADDVRVSRLHVLLNDLAVDEPEVSRTDTYHSTLSHYKLGDYLMELVGSFKVHASGSRYEVLVENLLLPEAKTAEIGGFSIPLMPLGHELVFNVLRERPDRYQAIAATMATDLGSHMPLLRRIFETCRLSRKHAVQIEKLLGLNGDGSHFRVAPEEPLHDEA
ncbi:hypothetical protein VQ056_20560 [Paenibacillus sp. JTLBN-2024]